MRPKIFTLLLLMVTAGAFASQNKKTVKLRLQSQTGNLDDATIYFDDGITPAYNSQEDAPMVFSNIPGVPEIYSYTLDKIPCSIYGAGDLSSTQVVSLGYRVNVNGIYNLSGIELSNFSPTSIIVLEDKKMNKFIDLRQNFYQVQLDTSDTTSSRFFLHVSYPIQFSSTPSNCSNNGGSISLTTDSTIIWNTCELYKDSGQLIAVDSNVYGTISFTNLAAGDYYSVISYNGYTTTQNFHLNGDYVVASIDGPKQPIYTLQDVTFNGISTNASHFSWDFGDGTLIEGVVNPEQTYYEPGTYTVNFTCSNDLGCSAIAQATVTVLLATGINNIIQKDVSISTVGTNIIVSLNNAANNNARLEVFNLLGQAVYNEPIVSQNQVISLEGQMPGYYIASVINADKVNTKRIFISK